MGVQRRTAVSSRGQPESNESDNRRGIVLDDRDDMMRDLMAMNDADLSDETPPFEENVEDVFLDPVQAVKDKSEMLKVGTKDFYFDLGEPIFFRSEATNN